MQKAIEIPVSPKGYYFSYILYQQNMIRHLYVFLCLFSYFVFYGVTKFVIHNPFLDAQGPALFWITILAIPVSGSLVAIIRRTTSYLLGYRVSFTISSLFNQLDTYTAEPGQLQKRSHTLFITLAPLSIYMLFCLLLLAGANGPVGSVCGLLLLMGLARMMVDLYFIWTLIFMPTGTLLYVMDEKERYVFEPDKAKKHSRASK